MKVVWILLSISALAALLSGTPVRAPYLQKTIPQLRSVGCEYTFAREKYLLAYGYRANDPIKAKHFLALAERALLACDEKSTTLKSRVGELKISIP